jgi:surface polysaccharide O-acyltransferase-like enzyme
MKTSIEKTVRRKCESSYFRFLFAITIMLLRHSLVKLAEVYVRKDESRTFVFSYVTEQQALACCYMEIASLPASFWSPHPYVPVA